MKLLLDEIVAFIKGELHKEENNSITKDNIAISGVSTDSRNITDGDLFVPLIGERFDGHSYINLAQNSGAVAALWQKDRDIPDGLTIPLIKVDDTLKALQELAHNYRKKINPIVIGVTGSNGKTTTKDLISSIISTEYRVHKTKGNLNNHIGLPLTLLSMPDNTEVVVVEMGMSNLGEIKVLSTIAQPDIAIITNIGESHIEFLKSRENIAKAKLEIIDGLKEGGTLVLLGDEPLLRNSEELKNKADNIIWVGKNEDNHLYPNEIQMDENNFTHFIDNEGKSYTVPLIGAHNVINSMISIQVGKLLNISEDNLHKGLLDLQITGMRLERMTAKNGALILNDVYNASPTSMRASLELLASFKGYAKKMAIIGDMLELGDMANVYHEEIGKLCAQLGIDLLFTTGEYGELMANKAINEGMSNENVYNISEIENIAKYTFELVDSDTVILVKASRGVHLEKVVEMLI